MALPLLLLLLSILLSLQMLPASRGPALHQVRTLLASNYSRSRSTSRHVDSHLRYGWSNSGFVNASTVGNSFKSMSCSLAIFTDDLLNGNVTITNQSFFTGLRVFANSLTNLQSNLSNLNSSLSDLNTTGATSVTFNAVQQITTVSNTYVTNLPNGANTGPMVLNYNSPINQATGTTPLASAFPSELGTFNGANTTLMFKLYASI